MIVVRGGCLLLFFFKQKTAYELHISDWSSDVCSSDLCPALETAGLGRGLGLFIGYRRRCGKCDDGWVVSDREDIDIRALVADPDQVGAAVDGEQIGIFHLPLLQQIGRASSRERVCQYV